MNNDFLNYYSSELDYLRKAGLDFAKENPKIAGRIGLNSSACADPYIERLMEGFAFLTARINYKFDSGYPKFSNYILNNMFPQFLNPVPSMCMVGIEPDYYNKDLREGFLVPRNTILRSISTSNISSCQFRTNYDVKLWPIKIDSSVYLEHLPFSVNKRNYNRSCFTVNLQSTAGLNFQDINVNYLDFYFSADAGGSSFYLLDLILSACSGIIIQYKGADGKDRKLEIPDFEEKLEHVGFRQNESLLTNNLKTLEGHRLLREFCIFSQKFMFIRLKGLQELIGKVNSNKIKLHFLFNKKCRTLLYTGPEVIKLYCTPAVNLFPKTLSRVHMRKKAHEYHIVAERTAPSDFEISEIYKVRGFKKNGEGIKEFYPLYNAEGFFRNNHMKRIYYTVNREIRKPTSDELENGFRTSYRGTEPFISLVDMDAAPYEGSISELEVKAYCSNRDLPMLMPVGVGKTDFHADINIIADSIKCYEGPTEPYMDHIFRPLWKTINYINLNYYGFGSYSPEEAADKIIGLMQAFSVKETPGKIVNLLKSMTVKNKLFRCREQGHYSYINGIEINQLFSEETREEPGIFILASVLNHFFPSIAPVNLIVETVLETTSRGIIKRWNPVNGISQMI